MSKVLDNKNCIQAELMSCFTYLVRSRSYKNEPEIFFDTDKHQMLSGTRDFPVNEKCPVVKKEKLFVDDNTKMKSLVKVVSCS